MRNLQVTVQLTQVESMKLKYLNEHSRELNLDFIVRYGLEGPNAHLDESIPYCKVQ